jgi:hypothetical protein
MRGVSWIVSLDLVSAKAQRCGEFEHLLFADRIAVRVTDWPAASIVRKGR